jgi:hypothetical protein
MDLMWLDGKTVLHVTDVATKYSSASVLENESAVSVWKALTLCWTTFFPGFPRIVHSDSGSQFTFAKRKELCEGVGVRLKLSPIENHKRSDLMSVFIPHCFAYTIRS